jgi:predicted LPLAT superfamily acyltransferase
MNTQPSWDGQSKGSARGTSVFLWLVSHCGVIPAYCLLVFVSFFYALADKRSAQALRSLRKRLGLRTSLFHRMRHCFSFGVSLIDKYAFLTGKDSFFRFESIREDLISGAVGKGRGAILLGAHFGNWEIAGNLLAHRLDAEVYCVMLDAERPDIKGMFKKAFDARTATIISVGGDGFDAMLAVHEAIKKNGIVCMMGDRIAPGGKTQVHNFLGGDVEFPLGPFAVAAATGAPIIPILITKSGLRKYIFKAYAPILFDGISRENRENFIFTAVERYVGILEQAVKERPYEWFNFYDFWKSNI